MIKIIRAWGLCAVLGGAALLAGCVAVPADPYGYSQPYYADPGPVVVQPNVYLEGSYYGRPHYSNPYYYNNRYYNHRYYNHPGYYGRPGYAHPGRDGRPLAVVPPAGAGAQTGGLAGITVPVPPGRTPAEINRMLNSPDSRNQSSAP